MMYRAFSTISLSALLTFSAVGAEEKKEEEASKADPNFIFQEDFEKLKPGDVPDEYFVIDGEWSVAEIDGGKAMKLSETPLVEAQVQLGESLKEAGGTIRARIKAEKKRRSYPRFGVGLHGMSGYRLRLLPAQNRLELVKSDELVQSAELEWSPGEWWFLELTVKPAGDAWTVTGRAWPESAAKPRKSMIDYIATDTKFSGKASVTGTPYAGLPIWIDDIEVLKIDEGKAGVPDEKKPE